jgi:hypothetical protein
MSSPSATSPFFPTPRALRCGTTGQVPRGWTIPGGRIRRRGGHVRGGRYDDDLGAGWRGVGVAATGQRAHAAFASSSGARAGSGA